MSTQSTTSDTNNPPWTSAGLQRRGVLYGSMLIGSGALLGDALLPACTASMSTSGANAPSQSPCPGESRPFASQWHDDLDQPWVGRDFWANPLQDWRIADGRLECRSQGGNRNVHILTHRLESVAEPFQLKVRVGRLQPGNNLGSAGFRIGVHDTINDHRSNLFFGKGVDAGITTDGRIILGKTQAPLKATLLEDVTLVLVAAPNANGQYVLTLTVTDTTSAAVLGEARTEVDGESLVGNLSLVNNFDGKAKDAARFWFGHWQGEGPKIVGDAARGFGPILWGMYTLSDSRGPEGHVLKLTAQMPPVGAESNRTVILEAKDPAGDWRLVDKEMIDPDSRTATFEVARWDADRATDYRLVYALKHRNGAETQHTWTGTVRKEPKDRPIVFAPLTCQHFDGFPYGPVSTNLKAMDPDLVYFSGDQLYEVNGGYWIVRTPVDDAILCYLGKYFMFGMAFGDLMRDRPTLCTPDDHDVFQPNIWGEGGHPTPYPLHDAGGYVQDPRFVNAVHRSQTAHHPRFHDPTPIDQGINVFYGDMVYGRVSFALVSDRMFKSGPKGKVDEWMEGHPERRADLLEDKNYDVRKLDKPGLDLLGRRQMSFLEAWAEDWRGADLKVVLSQSPFTQVLTHSGSKDWFFQGDLDAHGWPQTARNQAILTMRKAFPLHVTGDQHITSLVQYGVHEQRDACWSLCVPAISVGWQRWWIPDALGIPHQNRPPHNQPHTGEYVDGVGNKMYVYAIANPEGSAHPDRYRQADIRASGFSIVVIDPKGRTYDCASYRFLPGTDGKPVPFDGFSKVITQRENFAPAQLGHLPEVSYDRCPEPVVKVYIQKTRELVYAIRLQGPRVAPWAYTDADHIVLIGDPDRNHWITHLNQRIAH